MLQSEIKTGAHYAFREKRKPGIPFERLKVWDAAMDSDPA